MGIQKTEVKEFVADFETTVNTDHTEVWSAAYIDLAKKTHTDNVIIRTNIHDFLDDFFNMNCDVKVGFQNLKFDGNFILNELERRPDLDLIKGALPLYKLSEDGYPMLDADGEPILDLDEDGNIQYQDVRLSFRGPQGDKILRTYDHGYSYLVNDMGVWYSITVIMNGHKIEFYDTLKLLPFSVEEVGKAFDTQYKKTTMDYKVHQHADEEMTEDEIYYQKCDVLVMHEAINILHSEGLTKLTIGSCCMDFFKKPFKKHEFRNLFPDLTKCVCPVKGFRHADQYCRKAYKGGWCYLRKGYEDKVFYNGLTIDRNSMYPSEMRDHNNIFPIGFPKWWIGNEIPEEACEDGKVYFIRFKCFFDIKEGMLPTVQIKGNGWYNANEWLETSRVDGQRYGVGFDGRIEEIKPEMTMTSVDFELFLDHYDVDELEILDGCYFNTAVGLFDAYIDYWMERKVKAAEEGNKVLKALSKLYLNNCYGQFAKSEISSYKLFHLDENGVLKSEIVEEHEKETVFCPIGAFITSYARRKIISVSQANIEHFIYSDTDSCHFFDIKPEEVIDAPVHPSKLGYWGFETSWDFAIFSHQKTYIEHVTHNDLEPVDKPYYDIKCAGMGKNAKANLNKWLEYGYKKVSEGDEVFIEPFDITCFKSGLQVEGNLKARTVAGGTVLIDSVFKMR